MADSLVRCKVVRANAAASAKTAASAATCISARARQMWPAPDVTTTRAARGTNRWRKTARYCQRYASVGADSMHGTEKSASFAISFVSIANSAAWRSLAETHGFASRPHDRFAIVGLQ